MNIEQELIKKYQIELDKTIVVCYRGTDKFKEVSLASPDLYLKKAEKILQKNLDYKILIQTDQEQVKELFVNYFQNRCLYFSELPTTKDQQCIQEKKEQDIGMDKLEFAKKLLAVTHLMSQCKFVINHTGNMAAWICLFRGNTDNVFQFDQEGDLINNWKRIYWIIKIYIQKIKRKLKFF